MWPLTAKLQAILVGGGTFVLTALLGWFLHSADVARLELQQELALQTQEKQLKEICTADKAITTETSNAYQKQIADLGAQLADIKRLRPSRCVMPAAGTAARCDAAAGAGKPAEQDGIDTDTLYDFAGEAEQYRLQLIACQNFVKRTWAEKNQ